MGRLFLERRFLKRIGFQKLFGDSQIAPESFGHSPQACNFLSKGRYWNVIKHPHP